MGLLKVMLVDDEEIVREGLRNCMNWQTNGFEITASVENGLHALNYLEKHPVDLVVTDVRMPVMDGLELLHKSRESGYPAHFLILSGYDEFVYAQQALRYGAEDYILKPIKEDELLLALNRIRDQYFLKVQSSLNLNPDRYSGIVCQVISWVDMNISDPDLSLKQIAEEVLFMSGSYLSRLFLKETGYKFSTFLTIKRMELAERLILDNKDATVYEIAEQAGFGNNPQYFSTVFKKYFGKSPTELREQ
jgi:YesN/AraC family two-component response regulator